MLMKKEAHLHREWRQFLAFNLALFLSVSTTAGSDRTRKLSEDEARELAIMALTPDARKLPDLSLAIEKGFGAPGFYWFEATAATPNASPVLGHFAVNQSTGDVWDPVWCKKLTSPDLTDLQRQMRKRIHLSDRDLRRLSKEAPCEP